MNRAVLDTPVGRLTVTEADGFITTVDWRAGHAQGQSDLLDEALDQLRAYFDGRLQRFSLPMVVRNTAVVHGVQEAMLAIPYGETLTYGDIAKELEVSAQAVGQACGANPLPILIPCHRVVAAGNLGGYSGVGGIETKVQLLRLEGAASLLL